MNNVALYHLNGGEVEKAEPLFREALEGLRETVGSRHPYTLYAVGNLADLLAWERGEYDEALNVLGDSPTIACDTLGVTHELALLLAVKASRIVSARTSNIEPLREAVQRLEAGLGAEHAQSRKYAAVLAKQEAATIAARYSSSELSRRGLSF